MLNKTEEQVIFKPKDVYEYYCSLQGFSEKKAQSKKLGLSIRGKKAILGRGHMSDAKKRQMQVEIAKLQREKDALEEKIVKYALFLKITKAFNKRITKEICDGRTFIMGFKLGYMNILRKRRNPLNPRINYGMTMKLRKEGKLPEGKSIYYTDPEYLMWHWSKVNCLIKNKSVYRVDLTYSDTHDNGSAGNEFKKVLADSSLYYKFPLT